MSTHIRTYIHAHIQTYTNALKPIPTYKEVHKEIDKDKDVGKDED